jgi:hypothetical protein
MKTRQAAAAFSLLGLAACMSLQPVAEPARFIAETKPEMVYVTQGSGAIFEVMNPTLSGDTLIGTRLGSARHPVVLPWKYVQQISTMRRNKSRTVMLLAGITVASAVSVYAFTQGQNGHAAWACDYNTNALDGNGAPRCGPTQQ